MPRRRLCRNWAKSKFDTLLGRLFEFERMITRDRRPARVADVSVNDRPRCLTNVSGGDGEPRGRYDETARYFEFPMRNRNYVESLVPSSTRFRPFKESSAAQNSALSARSSEFRAPSKCHSRRCFLYTYAESEWRRVIIARNGKLLSAFYRENDLVDYFLFFRSILL